MTKNYFDPKTQKQRMYKQCFYCYVWIDIYTGKVMFEQCTCGKDCYPRKCNQMKQIGFFEGKKKKKKK